MKIVTSKQMVYLESQAYKDGSSEEEFMEEAGSGVALIVQEFVERYNLERQIILLCGKGNNSGDAYVAGVNLLQLEYTVLAYQLAPINETTPLCFKNFQRFIHEGGKVIELTNVDELDLPNECVIIDGIFGTGFRGKLEPLVENVIQKINDSRLPIISVDTPTGLNGETGEVEEGQAIRATETAFLGLPKLGFFINQGWDYVGRLRYVDFGLPKDYIEDAETDLDLVTPSQVKTYLPKIKNSRHKYNAGYVVGLASSPEMPGAGVLSSMAALHSGAGIVRLLYPRGMENFLAGVPYELLKSAYDFENHISVLDQLNKAGAAFIGPGLGRGDAVRKLLENIVPNIRVPCVFDADFLYHFAQKPIELPQNCIFTPHRGEMKELLQDEGVLPINLRYLKRCQKFAEDHKITLVLKGGPTFIFQPERKMLVCSVGDPGMATAGSGDLFTGLLASLLAQGIDPFQAACLGSYLHGIAGEMAADMKTSYCITSSDILDFYPDAFYAIKLNQWQNVY